MDLLDCMPVSARGVSYWLGVFGVGAICFLGSVLGSNFPGAFFNCIVDPSFRDFFDDSGI
jgi:hypothetical protein